jgi:hypothetical protein
MKARVLTRVLALGALGANAGEWPPPSELMAPGKSTAHGGDARSTKQVRAEFPTISPTTAEVIAKEDGGKTRPPSLRGAPTRAKVAEPALLATEGGAMQEGRVSSWLPRAERRLATAAGRWAPIADLPVARHTMGAAALNGKIYVLGGYVATSSGPLKSKSCVLFDPIANKWSPLADMPGVRRNLGAAALNGKIYVLGGYDGSSHNSRVL